MATRIVRFVPSAILLAAGCAALLWSWHLARHVDALQQRANLTYERIDRLENLLDELADQELVYVASGRAGDGVIETASSFLLQIVSESAALVAQSLAVEDPPARRVVETSEAIGEIEARARENLRGGLDVMAADLTFTETHAARRALRQQLRVLRTAEAGGASDARLAALKQAWAGLAGVALFLVWALIQRRAPAVAPLTISPTQPVASEPSVGEVSPESSPIAAAARLCTTLGQLKDETNLKSVMEELAALLKASGVVVWMGAGEELFPATSVGYDISELNRLGPIPRTAVNATAAAWRTGLLQTVSGDAESRSAVVAPMLAPDRCVGVLAIEVPAGREADVVTRAVASLIAAQLSAVLAAWPDASSAPTGDVLSFERTASVSG